MLDPGTLVRGFPTVRALDDDQQQLAVRVENGMTAIAGALPEWSSAPQPVTLAPGERASALVVWRNTYADTSTDPVTATDLKFSLSAGTQVVRPDGGVDLGSTGRLGVSAWRRPPR